MLDKLERIKINTELDLVNDCEEIFLLTIEKANFLNEINDF